MRTQKLAVTLAAMLMISAGCYYPDAYIGHAGRAPSAPNPSRGVPVINTGMSIGASLGVIMAPAGDAVIDGLDGGVSIGVNMSFWPIETDLLHFGVVADVASASLTDPYGGTMSITPATVSAVISVADPNIMDPAFRWRFGAGVGVTGISHSEFDPDVASIPVGLISVGQELYGRSGGSIRLYWSLDMMLGEIVDNNDPAGPSYWDLSSIYNAKFGLELGF